MKAERLNLRVEDNPSDVDLAQRALVLQDLKLPGVPAMYRAAGVLLGVSELPSPAARIEQ